MIRLQKVWIKPSRDRVTKGDAYALLIEAAGAGCTTRATSAPTAAKRPWSSGSSTSPTDIDVLKIEGTTIGRSGTGCSRNGDGSRAAVRGGFRGHTRHALRLGLPSPRNARSPSRRSTRPVTHRCATCSGLRRCCRAALVNLRTCASRRPTEWTPTRQRCGVCWWWNPTRTRGQNTWSSSTSTSRSMRNEYQQYQSEYPKENTAMAEVIQRARDEGKQAWNGAGDAACARAHRGRTHGPGTAVAAPVRHSDPTSCRETGAGFRG